MHTNADATTVLCFGDSNTYGAPADDPNYVRLPADIRWTGRLQQRLGSAYAVIEEGHNGRTTDLDYANRPGCNGRTYFAPCLRGHHPLDVIVIMLGSNDIKTEFSRAAADIADALHGYLDDIAANTTTRDGTHPTVILVSPITLDDSRPLYAELTAPSYDTVSVATSHQLAAEIRRVASERGTLFADAATVAHPGGDGLHLSLDSHDRLAALVASIITAAS